MDFLGQFGRQLYANFIKDNRFLYLVSGFKTTILITALSLVLGVTLGFLVAYVRTTHDKTGRMKVADAVCRLYLTVIRGTPTMVQLLIVYFVIFGSVNVSKLFVAVLAFGMNSGAYVAEIFRSGINSIDPGQMEAGRSLGLNYKQTTWSIIMPQAVKNVMPALGNEMITLLKETSISGYIAIQDLTKGGDIIRSRTYNAFIPLVTVALIYLVVVLVLEKLVKMMEKRLGQGDR